MTKHPPSHPHVVRLPISRAVLGDARFERTFRAVRYAADVLAEGDCDIRAIYEQDQRVAYVFAFRAEMAALKLRLYYDSVMRGRPLPLEVRR
jgi:hypothetical protein